MILNKEEVQQRTVYEGGRLPLELFEWDENTNTFSTKARGVTIDLTSGKYNHNLLVAVFNKEKQTC